MDRRDAGDIGHHMPMLDRVMYLLFLPRHLQRVKFWAFVARATRRWSSWVSRRYAGAMVDALELSAQQTPFAMTDSFVGATVRRFQEIANGPP